MTNAAQLYLIMVYSAERNNAGEFVPNEKLMHQVRSAQVTPGLAWQMELRLELVRAKRCKPKDPLFFIFAPFLFDPGKPEPLPKDSIRFTMLSPVDDETLVDLLPYRIQQEADGRWSAYYGEGFRYGPEKDRNKVLNWIQHTKQLESASFE